MFVIIRLKHRWCLSLSFDSHWSRVEVVTLNPEKQKMVATASAKHGHKVGLAA
jgi:hypothetical protein